MRLVFRSIRSNLVFLVLLAVLPALGIILHAGIEDRRQAMDDAREEALRLAANLVEIQERVAMGVRQMLSILALLPQVQNLDGPAISKVFARLLQENPLYTNILVTDPDGNLLASGREGAPGINVSDRGHFQEALTRLDFTAGEFIVARTTSEPAFPFAHPVLDSGGGLLGAIMTSVRLDSFLDWFDVAQLPAGSSVTVADRHGIRLFRNPAHPTIYPVGGRIKQEIWEGIVREGDAGLLEDTGLDGVARIFASRAVRLSSSGEPYMYVVVGIPASLPVARADRIMGRNLVLLAAATALALVTAWMVGNLTIGRAFGRLMEVTERFGRGEFSARTGLAGQGGELGRLALALEGMADALAAERSSRRAVESSLEESREFLDKIINAMADPVFVKDSRHRYVLVNEAECAASGRSREEMLGRTDLDFYSEEEVRVFWERDDLVLATGVSDAFEERITGASGETVIALVRKSRYVDGRGEAFVVGVVRDITDMRLAEAALRESRERFELFMAHLPAAVFIKDREGRVLFANRYLEDLFGWTGSVGKSTFDLLPRELAEVMVEDDRKALEKGFVAVKDRLVDRQGRTRVFETFKFAVPGGPGGACLGGVAVDVTEGEAARQAALQEQQRLQVLLDMTQMIDAPLPELTSFALHSAVSMSESAMGYLALLDEEGRAASSQMFFSSGVEEACRVAARPDRHPAGETGMWGEAVRLKGPVVANDFPAFHPARKGCPEGHVRIRRFMSVPVLDRGRVAAVVGVADKTGPYDEADVRRLSLLMEGMWGILRRKRAEDGLKESLREKEVLLKEIHHRVKNNMQLVTSLLNLQAMRTEDPEVREILERSQTRIRAMALVHEKLYGSADLSRIDIGDYLGSLVRHIAGIHKEAARNVQVVLDVDNLVLAVDLSIPCGLLVSELVSNAYKHAFPDGRAGSITVSLHAVNGRAELTVADDGKGLPPGFDMHVTESLGLQLVKSLAGQMRGELSFSRAHGAAFHLRFPLHHG